MSGNRLVLMIIFISVFIIMMFTALSSEVSVLAGLKRALSAALFFTALSFGTYYVIAHYVIDDIKLPANENIEEDSSVNEITGQMLDITVSESTEEELEDISLPTDEDDDNQSNQELNPLVTRQIDPNVEKVINNDPRRMAEIIKKMGFNE